MTTTSEDLHDLLPALYRIRDHQHGSVLQDLLAVLGRQADVLDRDIARLLDSWFVETCDPWVLAYIGDLLGIRIPAAGDPSTPGSLPLLPRAFNRRAYVANTIAYRRRKGTVAVIEQLAPDLTGWRARAVEFFRLLATTQYLNHLRPENVRTPDLRDTAALDLLDTAFDRVLRTAELRPAEVPSRRPNVESDRGRYNIPNLGLFVWRLESYPVGVFPEEDLPGSRPPTVGTARLMTEPADAGYTFSPLGLDTPLFTTPRTEPEITHLAEEVDVPGRLRRRALYEELEALRQAAVDGTPHTPLFFPPERPALRVIVPAAAEPLREVPPERILVCDLGAWGRPPATREYRPLDGGPSQPLPIEVAVDPTLGRLTLAEGVQPDGPVLVGYAYGMAGDLGGGPYDRRDGAALWFGADAVTWQVGVTKDQATLHTAADPAQLVSTLRDAVAAWNAHAAATPEAFGVIAVMDSATYREDLTGSFAVEVPAGARLAIVAAGWPGEVTVGPPVVVDRTIGPLAPDRLIRPHVDGNISVRGTAGAASPDPGALVVQGLLVEGRITVLAGNLGTLRLIDDTLVPAEGGLGVNPSISAGQRNGRLRILLDRSICGPIPLPETVPTLRVRDSVVDAAGAAAAIAASGTAVELNRVTILGATAVQTIEATSAIFTGPVVVERRQVGCVRFSSLPDAPPTQTPRRHRCQPDLALAGVAAADRVRRRAELTPAFGSTGYGNPAYGQLARTCAAEIRTGAEDGSEMGAFSSLIQPQREASLRAALEEYLRAGLEAGIITVT